MRRSSFRLLISLAAPCVAVGACSSSSTRGTFDEPTDAGVEAARAAPDASPPPLFGDAGRESGAAGSCERELVMGKLSISNPACFVNEHVSNRTTKIQFPCAGGKATAVFSGHTFTGTVQGDVIALSDVEKFVFNACDWESTEKIDGDLSKGTLTYSYTEKPVVSCSDLPCTGNGTVAVSAGAVTVVN